MRSKLIAGAAALAAGLTMVALPANASDIVTPYTTSIARDGEVELIVFHSGTHVSKATVQVLGGLDGTVTLEYTTSVGGTQRHSKVCDPGGADSCAWQFSVNKTYKHGTEITGGAEWNGKWIGIPELGV